MKKIVLIPDSYKGTASSLELCAVMKREILRVFPAAQVVSVPVADGGEGSVDCFLTALGGRRHTATVTGPLGQPMEAFYGMLPLAEGGVQTAVIEMAACAGLPLVKPRAPLEATTYGVGQLILEAVGAGARRILLGLGGSASTDGGCGAAAACGVQFKNAAGETFIPTGGTLGDIVSVSVAGLNPALQGVEIIAMCDIDNPLHGENGAAHVFGPQKGADPETVALLDAGLVQLDTVIMRDRGLSLAPMPGAGAAGGMGAGMMAFLGARLKLGIEAVLDTVCFGALIQGADLILTGEGRIDRQSLRGKVVIGVARRAKASGVPVVAIVGDISQGAEAAYGEGVSGIFSTNRLAVDLQQARPLAKENLAFTVYNLMHFIRAMGLPRRES